MSRVGISFNGAYDKSCKRDDSHPGFKLLSRESYAKKLQETRGQGKGRGDRDTLGHCIYHQLHVQAAMFHLVEIGKIICLPLFELFAMNCTSILAHSLCLNCSGQPFKSLLLSLNHSHKQFT